MKDFNQQLSEAPFKTAFKATIAFYLAQLVVTLIGISAFALVIFFAAKVLK